MKTVLFFLCLFSSIQAELIQSKDYLFIARPPIKLELTTGTHEQGKVASFQGYDEKSDIAYIIIVNQNLALADYIKKDPGGVRQILEANHKPYTDVMKALPSTVKTSFKKTLNKDSMSFQFECTGYHPSGIKTYHNGIRLFHNNALYTIQVASTRQATDREKPLKDLIDTFVLIDQPTQSKSPENSEAQYNVGLRHANGEGVQKDYAEAVKWYRKAADQGHAGAQCNLGVCYRNGEGLDKNHVEAVNWFMKAAIQGHAAAQFNLGLCYAKGEGVKKDYAEAVKWYRKAADQGEGEAQSNLGSCLASGEGVPKDAAEAVKWYRMAAVQGYTVAQHNLGFCYANGEGVQKDYAEAVKWYRRAAGQGHSSAQFNLALCYATGQGVSKNSVLAYMWWNISSELGNQPAAKSREIVARELTSEQIAEAKRLSKEWKPKKEMTNP